MGRLFVSRFCFGIGLGLIFASFSYGATLSTPATHDSNLENEVEPPRLAHLSVIAVGPVPARRYKLPNGSDSGKKKHVEAILVSPLEGSVPPPVLYYLDIKNEEVKDAESKDKEVEWSQLRVGFNRGAAVAEVPAGVPLVLSLRKQKRKQGRAVSDESPGGKGEAIPYVKLPPLPEASQTLCFLSSSNRGDVPWKMRPKINLLNIQSKALKDENLLVRNFSNHTVLVAIGDGKVSALGPGRRRSYQLKKSQPRHRVSASVKNQTTPIINTSLRMPDAALTVIVFYNTNPKNHPKIKGTTPIGVFRATVKRVRDQSQKAVVNDIK